MAKRSSKLNLGYFCAVKNIVPIILVAIIVFFVFNLLQNKSFNPLFEGMEGKKLNEMVAKISDKFGDIDMSGNISELIKEIDEHTTEHEKNNHNHNDIESKINTLQGNLPNFTNFAQELNSLKDHATNELKFSHYYQSRQ